MKLFNLILLSLFIFISFTANTFAAKEWNYNYPYVCKDGWSDWYDYDEVTCEWTQFDVIKTHKDWKYLTDVIANIEATSGLNWIVDNIIDELINYYWDETFTISGVLKVNPDFHEPYYEEVITEEKVENPNGSWTIIVENTEYILVEENDEYIVSNQSYTVEEIINTTDPIYILDYMDNKYYDKCIEAPDWSDEYCYYPQDPKIWWIFNNWTELFFAYFDLFIDKLHNWLPLWEKKDKLSDYHDNITSNKLDLDWNLDNTSTPKDIWFKNICVANPDPDNWIFECDETSKKYLSIYDNTSYKYIQWNIADNDSFVVNNFTVDPDYQVSSYNKKAWNSVYLQNFWFTSYLDPTYEETKFSYKLYYRYDWEWVPTIDQNANISEETIYIDKDFNIRSDTLSQDAIDTIFELDIKSKRSKKFSLYINEWVNLTKDWDIYFYLYAINETSWDYFDVSKVNSNPIKVLPSDDISNWNYEASMPDFSISENNDWYNHQTSFNVNIRLEDPYGNKHFDNIDWYDISFSDWTSPEVDMAEYWEEFYSKELKWVKSNPSDPYYINLRIKIPEPGWVYDFTWFDITAKEKADDSSYTNPEKTYTMKNVLPKELLDSNWQRVKIYIKAQDVVDFDIGSCTSWSVTLTADCKFDIWGSLCWWTDDEFYNTSRDRYRTTMSVWGETIRRTISFNNESDNWSSWTLTIIDNAYNTVWFNYGMNHIDQTAPKIKFSKWSNAISSSNTYSYKANWDSLFIDMEENTAWWSVNQWCIAQVQYTVKLNWTPIDSNVLWWVENTFFEDSVEIPNIFKTKWTKVLSVTASDKYWNTKTESITFEVYPDDVDELKSYVVNNSTDTKYADGNEAYNYDLVLLDKYWNTINWKEVRNINQHNCELLTSCSTLRTNMYDYNVKWIDDAWYDALLESWYSGQSSNSNWEISFDLKSIAPWEYSNIFKVEIEWWNNNYNNNGVIKTYNIYSKPWNESDWFKKLYIWQIQTYDKDADNWNWVPEFGTNMEYRVNIDNTTTYNSSNVQILDFKNFINVVDKENTSLQNVSEVSDLNTRQPKFDASINTSDNASDFGTPGIEISNNWVSAVYIRYNLWWYLITSWVSVNDLYNTNAPLSISNSSEDVFIWAKVVWLLQWDGKSSFAWLQEENFSDLSMSEVRGQIRKNAYNQIAKMRHNTIVWDVKYIDASKTWGTYTMDSDTSNYETLVVSNWDLIINNDVNLSWNKLWIIVLKDNYNVNNDFNSWNWWNIYVTPNVSQINAVVYSDGWFISSNQYWNPYLIDNSQRSSDLKNQLLLKWTLFTRNTIWWAFLVWWDYKLPWGWSLPDTASNFNKAMIYDLNYVRRWISNCITNWSWNCKYNDWAFIIEYNPNVQLNPPKLFLIN